MNIGRGNDGELQVVVRWLEGGSSSGEALLRFPHVNVGGGLSFSHDGDFLLCCPYDRYAFDKHEMQVLDLTFYYTILHSFVCTQTPLPCYFKINMLPSGIL